MGGPGQILQRSEALLIRCVSLAQAVRVSIGIS